MACSSSSSPMGLLLSRSSAPDGGRRGRSARRRPQALGSTPARPAGDLAARRREGVMGEGARRQRRSAEPGDASTRGESKKEGALELDLACGRRPGSRLSRAFPFLSLSCCAAISCWRPWPRSSPWSRSSGREKALQETILEDQSTKQKILLQLRAEANRAWEGRNRTPSAAAARFSSSSLRRRGWERTRRRLGREGDGAAPAATHAASAEGAALVEEAARTYVVCEKKRCWADGKDGDEKTQSRKALGTVMAMAPLDSIPPPLLEHIADGGWTTTVAQGPSADTAGNEPASSSLSNRISAAQSSGE